MRNFKMKIMQGITVKSHSTQLIMLLCCTPTRSFRKSYLNMVSRKCFTRLSYPPIERRTMCLRQSIIVLNTRASRILMIRCASILSSMLNRNMMLQEILQNLSLASQIRPSLQLFFSNFLKAAAFSLPRLTTKRQTSLLLNEQLMMMANRMKSTYIIKKWVMTQRNESMSSNLSQQGFLVPYMMILGNLLRQVLPAIVNIFQKISMDKPALYSLTVVCPRKKWQSDETSNIQQSWMMRIQARMIKVAQKGVLLIVPFVIIENRILTSAMRKSQMMRAKVQQTEVKTQRKYSQQKASILTNILVKPSMDYFILQCISSIIYALNYLLCSSDSYLFIKKLGVAAFLNAFSENI